MGYRVLGNTQQLFQGYGPRRGLEGPFVYANGRILYYDASAGQYWDPKTDFYVSQQEVDELQNDLMKVLTRQ
jgi:hypothetical protein